MSGSFSELLGLPLFRDVSPAALKALAEHGSHRNLAKKGVMISSEELSQRLHVLLSGRMKMVRPTAGGDESVQQRLEEGDVFCLVSMVSGLHCGSYGESMEPCTLLSWPHRAFAQLMEKDRQLHVNMLRQLTQQVELERHKRCLVQCSNIAMRVAGYLLLQRQTRCRIDSDYIDLRPITLSAQELGMARETMSRTFSALERSGVVLCCRGVIKICDHERLQMIADGMDICCDLPCKINNR